VSTAVDSKSNQGSKPGFLEKMVAQARLEVCPDRCLKLRHRKSGCRACLDSCPAEAISFGDSLEIDYSRCYGCGICAGLCPTEVFILGGYSYHALLVQVTGKSSVEFNCSRRSPEVEDGVTVPCLAYLDESFLIAVISRGAQTVALDITLCADCPLQSGFQSLQRNLEKANKILALFGREGKIRLATGGKNTLRGGQDIRQYSRREPLSYLGRGVRNMAAGMQEHEVKGWNQTRAGLEPRLPENRRLLLRSLKALGKPVINTLEGRDLPFLRIEMAGDCDSCGLCATFCPSGALQLHDREGKRVIEFNQAHCLACGLCLEICPKQALCSSTTISVPDLLAGGTRLIAEHMTSTCTRCGQAGILSAGSGLCLNCHKDKNIREWLIR